MDPAMPVEHRLVPSSGSTAISTVNTAPPSLDAGAAPTFSPIYSMGARSRSPSPITIVPSIAIVSRQRRMDSTAAWSDALASPIPMVRADAMAASSTTRSISSERSNMWYVLLMDINTILVLSADLADPELALLEELPPETGIVVGNSVEAFETRAPEANVIFNWSGSNRLLRDVFRISPNVRWVHSRSAGLDNVLFPELTESPVPL